MKTYGDVSWRRLVSFTPRTLAHFMPQHSVDIA